MPFPLLTITTARPSGGAAPTNPGDGTFENLGQTTASSQGTSISTHASADTKGTWQTVGTTTFDWLSFQFQAGRSAHQADYTIDIGISDGMGGVTKTLAEDLKVSSRKQAADDYVAPPTIEVAVPSGSVLVARAQGSTGTSSVDVVLVGSSVGWGFDRLVALYTPATSSGVVLDPGGTANTKVRTEVIASTPAAVVGIFAMFGEAGDTGRTTATWLMDVETGAAASEVVIVPGIFAGSNTSNDVVNPPSVGPFWKHVASGTRISVNIQCSSNTAGDRTLDIALYGYVE